MGNAPNHKSTQLRSSDAEKTDAVENVLIGVLPRFGFQNCEKEAQEELVEEGDDTHCDSPPSSAELDPPPQPVSKACQTPSTTALTKGDPGFHYSTVTFRSASVSGEAMLLIRDTDRPRHQGPGLVPRHIYNRFFHGATSSMAFFIGLTVRFSAVRRGLSLYLSFQAGLGGDKLGSGATFLINCVRDLQKTISPGAAGETKVDTSPGHCVVSVECTMPALIAGYGSATISRTGVPMEDLPLPMPWDSSLPSAEQDEAECNTGRALRWLKAPDTQQALTICWGCSYVDLAASRLTRIPMVGSCKFSRIIGDHPNHALTLYLGTAPGAPTEVVHTWRLNECG